MKSGLKDIHSGRRAFKTDPGKLFKGHSMEILTYSDDDGSSIQMRQGYFNFTVDQQYLSKSNTTDISLTYTIHPSKSPKWYLQLLEDLQNIGNVWAARLCCVDGEYELHFNSTWIYLIRGYNVDGIHMTNHYENIKSKKELSKMASRLMYNFKEIPLVDLLKFERDPDNGIINIPPELIF
jgi:hypothetical protein